MTQSGVIEYDVLSYEDFMLNPWFYYNEDCDPGRAGRIIIDDDYLRDMVWIEEMNLSFDYYLSR